MKTASKNRIIRGKEEMSENIFNSMIASFRIEKINIPEKEAREIYHKVRKRLKKEA